MYEIGKQLAMINNAVRRSVEKDIQCELMKLSMSNGWILMYLHDHKDEEVFQKNIEEAFNITRSTASKVISLMETKGLLERHPVPGDARLKRLVITDLGEEMRRGIIDGRKKMEETLTEGFSEDELSLLNSYLERLKKNVGEKGECKK